MLSQSFNGNIKNQTHLQRSFLSTSKFSERYKFNNFYLGIKINTLLFIPYINDLHKSFFSIWVFFHNHSRTTGLQGKEESISSLPLPHASQTFRHYPGDYCRDLTSAHRQQPDSNREPLVSERKSITTKLRALHKVSRI